MLCLQGDFDEMLGGKTFEGMTSSDEDEDEEESEEGDGLPTLASDDIIGDFDGAHCTQCAATATSLLNPGPCKP